MGFVTNNPPIVQSACNAYRDNLTIVNNIPKDGKKYDNTLKNFAIIDNNLAQAQEAIGSSSNIAQIAQTYMYSFPNEQKYVDYVCILAVLAQCAIDNCKRTFDVNINSEINRISKDMNIKNNGYPIFWKSIQDSKRAKSGAKAFDSTRVNKELVCPMNYLYQMQVPTFRNTESTLEIDYFFSPHELDVDRRKSKKVEDLISEYSLLAFNRNKETDDDYILFENDYEEFLDKLRTVYISNGYIGLTSWLIDRAFCITPQMKSNKNTINSNTNKNKSLLLKILFDINPSNVLKCFSKNISKKE